MITIVNLAEKFSKLTDCWSPKVVGDVNEMHVKVVKIAGESSGTTMMRRTSSSSSSAAGC
jgi:hypothetical protein